MRIGYESLTALLQRQGYQPHRHRDRHRRVRGARLDLRHVPRRARPGPAARLLRRRARIAAAVRSRAPSAPPARSTATCCCPRARRCSTRTRVKRFRARYRELFGANATQDPLYQAVSDGRRLAGMEHWLPLFEDRLATLFDHLGDDDLVVIDAARDRRGRGAAGRHRRLLTASAATPPGRRRAATARCRPTRSTCRARNSPRRSTQRPVHRAAIFAEPESAKAIDFGFRSARDFAPERSRGDNVYEAAAAHFQIARQGRQAAAVRRLFRRLAQPHRLDPRRGRAPR